MSTFFLFTMPGGGEWILIILFLVFLIAAPVVAIVYLMKARQLRKENKALQQKIMERY